MAEDEPVPAPEIDPKVQLSFGQLSAVIDHINRKAVSPIDACMVCGSHDNNVLPDIYRIDVATEPLVVGGVHQPLISTVCNNCGFVRFFNRLVVDRCIQEFEAAKAAADIPTDPQAQNGG